MKLSKQALVVMSVSSVMVIGAAYFAAGPDTGPSSPPISAPSPFSAPPPLIEATTDGSDPYDKLEPYENGPGVLVSDPMAEGPIEANIEAFGTACTRWMQLVISDQAKLGQTPTLLNIYADSDQKNRKIWQLQAGNVDDMELASRSLGVTHVLTSKLNGNAQNLSLELQLVTAPEAQLVGEAIQLSGSPEQIVAALPGATRRVLSALEIENPRVPAPIGATPDEFIVCGQALREPWQALPNTLKEKLRRLGTRFPLAALAGAGEGEASFIPLLLPNGSQSLAIMAYVAETAPYQMLPYSNSGSPVAGFSPQNYQALVIARQSGLQANARSMAEMAVRAAPRNPWAWVQLSIVLGDTADATRKGRTTDRMSPAEVQEVQNLYALQQAAAARAVKLDDRNASAWLQVAVAAMFNGDNEAATKAFWTAQRLQPDYELIYNWGLQMHQPKWGGNPATLLQVVELAAANDSLLLRTAGSLAEALSASDWRDPLVQKVWHRLFSVALVGPQGLLEKQPKLRALLSRDWQIAQKQPQNAAVWQSLAQNTAEAAAALRRGRYYDALNRHERPVLSSLYGCWHFAAHRVTVLQPKNARAWVDLSRAQAFGPNSLQWAGESYSKALSLAPRDARVYIWGLQLHQPKWSGDPDQLWNLAQKIAGTPSVFEAVAPQLALALETLPAPNAAQKALLQKALAQVKVLEKRANDAQAQEAVQLFWSAKRDHPRAVMAAKNWVRLAPRDAVAHFQLGGALHNNIVNVKGAAQEVMAAQAMEHYRRTLQLNPSHGEAAFHLGSLLVADGQPKAAEKAFVQATNLQPYWTDAWMQRAILAYNSQRKAELEKICQHILTLTDNADSDSDATWARSVLNRLNRDPRSVHSTFTTTMSHSAPNR